MSAKSLQIILFINNILLGFQTLSIEGKQCLFVVTITMLSWGHNELTMMSPTAAYQGSQKCFEQPQWVSELASGLTSHQQWGHTEIRPRFKASSERPVKQGVDLAIAGPAWDSLHYSRSINSPKHTLREKVGVPNAVLKIYSEYRSLLLKSRRKELQILTLKAPITTAADDIHKYFFIVF